MLCGLILRIAGVTNVMQKISIHFNNIFMILLLPPIIFESGYNMHHKSFFRNIGTVIMFSFIGTFIAIFSTSFLFYLSGKYLPKSWHPEFTMKESFAFGSLISATDPVSVLAIFKELDADQNLYAVVFGESIFNDAIGIVMYDTVKKLGQDDKSFGEEVVHAFL
jgi:NhaP-type Na+/H+ or K+/H+ antiporter